MNAVVTSALPVFALILTGWLAARWRILGAGATDALNRYVVYLSLPALLFRAMTQVDLTHMAHWGFVGAFAGGIAVTFLASFLGARRTQRALTDRGIQGLAASYANAGYMGIPLCLALLGPDSMAPATFTTLLTASVLFGFAIALIEFDRQQTPNLSLTLFKVGRALLRNPLLAAPLLGLAWAFTGLALPEGVDRYVALLGASASPCALVTIGLFLAQTETSSSGPGVMRLVAGKLLLQPAVTAVLAFYVFAMPPVWAWTAVLMSALPIGTGPFMLAQMYGRDARVTSRAILVSTVASVLTVSLLVAWISAHPIS
ncbi:AEC family transporter [Achromobacter xylosoxidans]|uniref:AEC family transporter n=1 Tax=Alcaligenes xylosoxydans xylosoxydans TaxID=85698 RepID=A0A424WG18_ALCXX|nr:AEC family transporter [Achromobacter xylosoxidans]MBC9905404.1 AEC family transporter [Achromobacter xylosoxidans]MBD0869022.1 AEC family transporter [Achromobacter xylosoxidans]QNP84160.1 AEC family transporter [Achromobacter xylosoxidans]RPJ92226.1 AEC family transporter [Achromobacter xylosoxidans]